jgi:predicted ABC-type ATPase
LTRVISRALAGGHSAPAEQLQKIHESSLKNLPRAIREMDRVVVYDNSTTDQRPKRILAASHGRVTRRDRACPEWLRQALPAPVIGSTVKWLSSGSASPNR